MSPRLLLALLVASACSGGGKDPAATDDTDTTVADTPADDTDDTTVDTDDTTVEDTVEDTPVDTTPVDLDLDGYLSDVDCDDANNASFPGNPEICDGFDNDCVDGLAATELDLTGDGLPECAAATCPATGMAYLTSGDALAATSAPTVAFGIRDSKRRNHSSSAAGAARIISRGKL